MTVNLGENPMDFVAIVNPAYLSYTDLVDIASALISAPISSSDNIGRGIQESQNLCYSRRLLRF